MREKTAIANLPYNKEVVRVHHRAVMSTILRVMALETDAVFYVVDTILECVLLELPG